MKPGEIKLTIDDQALQLALERVPRLLRIAMEFRLKRHAVFFERQIDNVFTASPSGPWKINRTADKLINRTGSLRRSFRARVIQPRGTDGASDTVLTASIGNARTAHYVFTQEYGATIRPTSARMLAIPAPANLTQAGRPRFTSPSAVEGLFVLRKNGKVFLARPRDNGGVEILWILKASVTVKPRLGFRRIWRSATTRNHRISEIQAGVTDTLRKARLVV